MKKLLITIILLLCLMICACEQIEQQEFEVKENDRFVPVFQQIGKTNDKIIVYVDKETGVMYICAKSGTGSISIAVMLDQDGKPLIWKGVEQE